MKVSKENDTHILSIYQPDEKEKELLYKVSDEVIDLIDKYNLNDDQRIHLISSLYVSMKETYDIVKMEHQTDDTSEVATE